ncbi:MAG: hypothetical protein AAGJ93_13380 [Bacteroidota bacterium]
MKLLTQRTVVVLLALAFTACQGDTSNSNTTTNATTPATTTLPAAATGIVYHYTCPNGHPGASGKGACSQCGTELVHNQAFHANDQPAAATNSNPMQQFAPAAAAANSTAPATPSPAAASPAQNAAGVYHYTCSSGCAGGAAGAGNCANCGNPLAHNQAYHN